MNYDLCLIGIVGYIHNHGCDKSHSSIDQDSHWKISVSATVKLNFFLKM